MKNIIHSSIICMIALIILPFFSSTTFAQSTPIAITPDSIVQITTILPGTTNPQTLTVSVKNGIAMLEGDIILGPIAELQSAQDRGAVIDGLIPALIRWPDGEIPYVIESGFTASYIVLLLTAIDYINASTHLLLVPRQSQTDYVHFTPSNACNSDVGRKIVGLQSVNLMDPFAPGSGGSGCYFPQIVHEIAHAAGLWHEQSREDRDNFVTIHLENVQANQVSNFDKHVSDGIDIGPYDFASDMHYGPTAFTKNGLPTITANNGQAFGNTTEYSVGDIAAINWMYPTNNCPSNFTLVQNIPQVVRPMVFEVSNTVTSTATIVSGNDITYDAAVRVILSPGFVALAGSTFKAVNEGCGGIYQRGASAEVDEWMSAAEISQNEQQQLTAQPSANALPDLNIAPNPFSGNTVITYNLPSAQKVDLQIFNMVGKLIAQPIQQEYEEAGVHDYNYQAGNLLPGVYFLVLQSGGQKVTKRLVLSR